MHSYAKQNRLHSFEGGIQLKFVILATWIKWVCWRWEYKYTSHSNRGYDNSTKVIRASDDVFLIENRRNKSTFYIEEICFVIKKI